MQTFNKKQPAAAEGRSGQAAPARILDIGNAGVTRLPWPIDAAGAVRLHPTMYPLIAKQPIALLLLHQTSGLPCARLAKNAVMRASS